MPQDPMAGVLAGEQSRIQELQGKQTALEGQGADIEKRQMDRSASIEDRYEKTLDALKPPKFAPVPPPTVPSTDPKTMWGSSAMWLAGIASLMTRQPLTTAMNAAASAIKGFHEGDLAAANQAFQSWKIASDNAMKAFEFENQAYRDAIGRTEKRAEFEERQSTAQTSLEERERVSQLNAVGRSLQDTFMANVKSVEEAERMIEQRQTHADNLARYAGTIESQKLMADSLDAYKKDPANQSKTPEDQRMDQLKIIRDFSPTAFTQSMDNPKNQEQYANQAIARLMKTGPGAEWKAISVYGAPAKEAADKLARGEKLNNTEQNALLDAQQRILTNQAIRIGLVNLNLQHMSVWDQASNAIQHFQQGGPIPPAQAKNIAALMGEIIDKSTGAYGNAIKAEMDKAAYFGVEPALVVPPDFDPSQLGGYTGDASKIKPHDNAQHVGEPLPKDLREKFDAVKKNPKSPKAVTEAIRRFKDAGYDVSGLQ